MSIRLQQLQMSEDQNNFQILSEAFGKGLIELVSEIARNEKIKDAIEKYVAILEKNKKIKKKIKMIKKKKKKKEEKRKERNKNNFELKN